MAEFTLYESQGEVHTSTADAEDERDVKQLFNYKIKFTRTAGKVMMRLPARKQAGNRKDTFYLQYDPVYGGASLSPPLDRMVTFAEEEAGVSVISEPSIADDAAVLDAYSNKHDDVTYPALVEENLRELEMVSVEVPSYEHAIGLAEHTTSVWADASVAVLEKADLRNMDGFDVMIGVDELRDDIQPTEETRAAAEELEREASQEQAQVRFDRIRQEVRELMISDQVPDSEVQARVRTMVDPTRYDDRSSGSPISNVGNLLPDPLQLTLFQLAVGVLLGVIGLGLGVLGRILIGRVSLPSVSIPVPSLPTGALVPGGVGLIPLAVGGAVLAVLLIALTTVIASRS